MQEQVNKSGSNQESVSTANVPVGQEKTLNDHYTIGSALPQFDSGFAKAYQIFANKNPSGMPLYILVLNRQFSIRMQAIKALYKLDLPGIVSIIDYGIWHSNNINDEHFGVVLTQPEGIKFTEIIGKEVIAERAIVEKFIRPLNAALGVMRSRNFMHGSIYHGNIYYDTKNENLTIGECVSEYPGFSQSSIYEPLNRATCNASAKTPNDLSADYFALGVLIFELLSGKSLEALGQDPEILITRLSEGSYSVVVGNYRISYAMQELLRGLLNDSPQSRWQYDEIEQWLSRKRNESSNVTILKETMYSYNFNSRDYFSRKALAHALFMNWNLGRQKVKIDDLARWLRNNLMKPEMAHKMDAILAAAKKELLILDDDHLARVISVLDSEGPMRFIDNSVSVEGLGNFLAYAYQQSNRNVLQFMGGLFQLGIIEHWINLQPNPDDYSQTNLGWSPNTMMRYLRKTSLGFGMERCLYDMNHNLPCQSPMLDKHYISSLGSLLNYLDVIAEANMGERDPMDRHIAAFIASKINLPDDIRIKGMTSFPEVMKNTQIQMLGLLALAQAQSKTRALKNLAEWLHIRLEGVVKMLHGKTVQRELERNLERASRDGNLTILFQHATDPAIFKRDRANYQEARMQHKNLSHQIAHLEHQKNIERKAYEYGLRVAVTISYLTCALSGLFMLFKLQ